MIDIIFYDNLALLSSEMFCQQKALTGSRARLLRGRWPVCMDPFAESRLFPSACGAWKRLKGWPERSQDRRVLRRRLCESPGEGISPQWAPIPAHADGPSNNNTSALSRFFTSGGRPAPEPAQDEARIHGSVTAEDGFSLSR